MTQIHTWHPDMIPMCPAAIAIGVFDGVHIGHQALIRDTVEFAHTLDAGSAAVTFDRDPDRVVSPDAAAPQLLELDDKLHFLAQSGVDHVLVVPFDAALAAMTPHRFLHDVLLSSFVPVAVVVGHDFRFGNRAAGDVTALERFGADHSFTVIAHELVIVEGIPVTSTRVRAAIAKGDVSDARRLLGRPHRLYGSVIHGRGEGARLAVPTANLSVRHEVALPTDGVYAGWAHVDGDRYPAAISVGLPPSYPSARDKLEAHIIGWEGDIYGSRILLEFAERLRSQQRFNSPEALADAIASDIDAVGRITTAH